jgi:hypothetical protein
MIFRRRRMAQAPKEWIDERIIQQTVILSEA